MAQHQTQQLKHSPDSILLAVQLLRAGEVVAIPTETVYGLGADALDPAAVAKIFQAKGRPQDNPLIVHIADKEAAKKLVKNVPETEFNLLADTFWPGPLTIVLDKNEIVPDVTTGGHDSVALRIPAHATALAIIARSQLAIAAPSANSSGRPSPTMAKHVFEDLNGRIPLIIDGGTCNKGLESTVLDLRSKPFSVLRPGSITAKMISECLGQSIVYDPACDGISEQQSARAPGMKYTHYAPNAPITLISGAKDPVRTKIKQLLAEKHGNSVVILSKSGDFSCSAPIFQLNMDSQGSNLFELLRDAEKMGAKHIIIEEPEHAEQNMALLNRLNKAATHKITA